MQLCTTSETISFARNLEEKSGEFYETLSQKYTEAKDLIGFREEKRAFSPHLTLGRVKSPRKKRELAQKLEDYRQCECGTFEAKEVCLLKSELKPGGAVYTKLRTFHFTILNINHKRKM